jgi:hypothetical protein
VLRTALAIVIVAVALASCARHDDALDRLRAGPVVIRVLGAQGGVMAEARVDGARIDVTAGEVHGTQVGDRLVLDGGAEVPGVAAFDVRALLDELGDRDDVVVTDGVARVPAGAFVLELRPG